MKTTAKERKHFRSIYADDVALNGASYSDGSTTMLRFLDDIDALKTALEACNAQIMADTKSLAAETSMSVKGHACEWKEFMPPAWIEAEKLLSE